MSTRMSKTLKRLILVCLIAAAGFGAGRLSLFGAVERQQTQAQSANAQVQDLLADLDRLNIDMAAREGYFAEAEALWAQQQEVLEQNLANAGKNLTTAEAEAAAAKRELRSLQQQFDALNAKTFGTSDGDFQFQWDTYPEFQPVLEPTSIEEYLSPHWTDKVYGDPNAPVQIVEFFSYACPHCKTFHEGPYQQLLNDYMNEGVVKVVKRDFLLNSRIIGFELMAGAGAQCLSDPFLSQRFADLVFAQQGELAQAQDPAEALLPIFVSLGLAEDQARACMRTHRSMSLVFGRAARAAQTADVHGTPTLFINGEKFAGNPNDYAALSAAIDAAVLNGN